MALPFLCHHSGPLPDPWISLQKFLHYLHFHVDSFPLGKSWIGFTAMYAPREMSAAVPMVKATFPRARLIPSGSHIHIPSHVRQTKSIIIGEKLSYRTPYTHWK